MAVSGILQHLLISIHALREEGDTAATWHRRPPSNFYPRPPRGGRQPFIVQITASSLFLSTPSARRATVKIGQEVFQNLFLSTPSARRATLCCHQGGPAPGISIHALREEGDTPKYYFCQAFYYFYPRPPRGGRPLEKSRLKGPLYFYPRPPRGGRPASTPPPWSSVAHFYPRPPRGGRPQSAP